MGSPLDVLIDNPIIVKNFRTRMRPSQVIAPTIVVACICLLMTAVGVANGSMGGTVSYSFLVFIAWVILVIGGSNQVVNTVGAAKESGILDFHRVSPLPASSVAIGFFLGAPLRELLMFALIVPFLILSAVLSSTSLSDVATTIVGTLMTAFVMNAAGLLVALVAKRPRNASAGLIVLLIIGMMSGNGIYSSYRGARLMASGAEVDPGGIDFFGVRLPTVAFLLLYEGAAVLFLMLAATRKMRAEGAMAYSKPEAIACMATIVTLGLGASWKVGQSAWVVPALLYLFVVAGMVLSTTVQPDMNAYCKGIRRALRVGRRRPPVFAELASNTWAVYGLAGLVALGATIAADVIEPGTPWLPMPNAPVVQGPFSYSLTIAIGVFTVAYFGMGKQYFALKFGRRSDTYFRLFLFLVWILPLLIGTAIGVAWLGARATQTVLGISPWAGMILSIKGIPGIESEAADVVRFVALFPSLALAFLFHFLLVNEQRRMDIRLRETSTPPAKRDLVFLAAE